MRRPGAPLAQTDLQPLGNHADAATGRELRGHSTKGEPDVVEHAWRRAAAVRERDARPARRRKREGGHSLAGRSPDQPDAVATAFVNMADAVLVLDGSGTVMWGNPSAQRLFGRTLNDWVGEPGLDLVHPDDQAVAQRALSNTDGTEEVAAVEVRLDSANGWCFVELAGRPLRWEDEDAVLVCLRDATQHRRSETAGARHAAGVWAEHDLREELSRMTATLDSIADGVLVVDLAGKVTDFNRRFVEIWGIAGEDVARDDDVAELAVALERLREPNAFTARLEGLEAPDSESCDLLEFKDGRVVERYARPQLVAGELIGWVHSFRDVTDRKLLEDELSYWAFHDSLTRLANKSLFQDRLKHALSDCLQTGSHLAVLFIDLDDFKTVNDSLGHGAGDQLLRRVAKTLADMLGPSGTAARLGGDEFAILIEDVPSRESVTELAQRILESLRPPVRLGTKSVSAASSIGIAFDLEGLNSEQLLRNADIAMYQAKKLGKDRFEVYRDEMHALVLARIDLEAELKAAISEERLVAYYQPVMDLHNYRVAGFEALVRWPQPDGTVIDPGQFVPMAQEVGLIGDIDALVLRTACRQVREWQETGLCGDLEIGVNLSAGQLADPELSDRIAAQLEECRFDPRSLVLEITESEVITDNEITMRNLASLRNLGVRIALDDFGTGYSTFSHLDRLPIDVVKIDRSFVMNLGSADDSRSMAAALIQLARTLGYDTIAEGVETPAQERSLRALGCARAQGYYLGRPLEAQAARWVLTAQPMPDPADDEALSA